VQPGLSRPAVAARQLFRRNRIGSLDRQHLRADELGSARCVRGEAAGGAGLHADHVDAQVDHGPRVDHAGQVGLGSAPDDLDDLVEDARRKDLDGNGKRVRDQHESIIIAVRGAVPPALPLWGSVLVAPIGEPSEKPKVLAEMIDRDYAPALTRVEMFARPPFDRRGWSYWGDAVPGGLMFAP
jgi:hypothetical protein